MKWRSSRRTLKTPQTKLHRGSFMFICILSFVFVLISNMFIYPQVAADKSSIIPLKCTNVLIVFRPESRIRRSSQADLRSATHRTTWTSGSGSWRTLGPTCSRPAVRRFSSFLPSGGWKASSRCLLPSALNKCPTLRLKCPRGLREPDFLDLLRSSFPQQCGGDGRFEVLTSDRRRRLRPLRVAALTAEEIDRNAGGSGGKSTIYIRLKVANTRT